MLGLLFMLMLVVRDLQPPNLFSSPKFKLHLCPSPRTGMQPLIPPWCTGIFPEMLFFYRSNWATFPSLRSISCSHPPAWHCHYFLVIMWIFFCSWILRCTSVSLCRISKTCLLLYCPKFHLFQKLGPSFSPAPESGSHGISVISVTGRAEEHFE